MTQSPKKGSSSPTGQERRRTRRRPILETFSIFIVIPKKGLHRLEVQNISEDGMGFDLDVEGESPHNSPIKIGDTVDFRFYLNQSLFIPLSIQVVRVEEHHTGRRIGAEFQDKSTPGYKAFLSLLHFFDHVVDVVQIDK